MHVCLKIVALNVYSKLRKGENKLPISFAVRGRLGFFFLREMEAAPFFKRLFTQAMSNVYKDLYDKCIQ